MPDRPDDPDNRLLAAAHRRAFRGRAGRPQQPAAGHFSSQRSRGLPFATRGDRATVINVALGKPGASTVQLYRRDAVADRGRQVLEKRPALRAFGGLATQVDAACRAALEQALQCNLDVWETSICHQAGDAGGVTASVPAGDGRKLTN